MAHFLQSSISIRLNHRRIGLIMLPSRRPVGKTAYYGYSTALTTAGLPINPTLAETAGPTRADGVTTMHALLSLPEPPSTILVSSDELASGAMYGTLHR